MDFLEKYRRRPASQAAAGEPPSMPAPEIAGAHAPYEAFHAKDKIRRLDIRANDGLSHSLAYGYLVLVTYDYFDWRKIFITGGGIAVQITGERLHPVMEALKLQTCALIQPYLPDRFAPPLEPSAAYIDTIEVEVIRASALPAKQE